MQIGLLIVNIIGLVPGAPHLSLISTSTDSVTVSWSVPTGTVVETFDLHWAVEGDQQLLTTSTDTVDTNQYIISGLSELENATVRIVVTTVNGAGRNSSTPLTFNSNILQNMDPEEDNTDTTGSTIPLGALIGGAVGIFLASYDCGYLNQQSWKEQ